ncbi:MAG: dipeptidase [Gemmatimonadota bacterium]|jgi:acetylornithine deacetylase/succinyl-diaminopimelate desuccinylase-like protein
MSDLTSFVERERLRLLADLTDWLRIPSVSTLPEHAGDCRRAAEWLAARLKNLGFRVDTIETERHPILWAEGPAVPGAPTVLCYGHYDVQPPDPLHEWVSPPFEPTVRDGKIFARGTADDKGQVFCVVSALEGLRKTNGSLPLNVRLLIEGEEEVGSKGLTKFLTSEPGRTAADAVLVTDVHMVAPGYPSVDAALRGIVHAEIHVRTLKSDLHSGLYGGAAPNAIETLWHLLERLKGPDGKIKVPGIYDRVKRPSAKELKAWRSLPIKERGFRNEAGAKALNGEQRFGFLERVWGRPTLEVHGIVGGFTGAGAKTVIPAEATAKCSLRLVPDQRAKEVAALFQKAVKRAAPQYADVTVTILSQSDPVQTPLDAWPFEVLDQAYREVWKRGISPIRSGGSIPIVPLLQQRKAPVLLTGIGLPDDGLHGPNEKLNLEQLWKGIVLFGRFFELMGDRKSSVVVP